MIKGPPVEMVCSQCGGRNVRRDAWADWDVELQAWTLGAVFDNAHCDDCEGECKIEGKPL